MSMPFVSDLLDQASIAYARSVGRARYEHALERKRAQPYGDPGNDNRLVVDEWGAVAESAVAAYTGLPWHDEIVDDPRGRPDVGSRIDAKWTRHVRGHLIVHADENLHEDWVYVSVFGPAGRPGEIRIGGWTTGLCAKQARYAGHRCARNPVIDRWVPQEHLLMPDLLLDMTVVLA